VLWILSPTLSAALQRSFLQEVMMGLSPAYEKWRQETLAEGVQQGIQQGVQQIVERMLQGNFSLEAIAPVTGLSIEELQRLQADQPPV
jgi:predicted transposase/invertase (TIGR01784 family)